MPPIAWTVAPAENNVFNLFHQPSPPSSFLFLSAITAFSSLSPSSAQGRTREPEGRKARETGDEEGGKKKERGNFQLSSSSSPPPLFPVLFFFFFVLIPRDSYFIVASSSSSSSSSFLPSTFSQPHIPPLPPSVVALAKEGGGSRDKKRSF